jgi:hypothetical protein
LKLTTQLALKSVDNHQENEMGLIELICALLGIPNTGGW